MVLGFAQQKCEQQCVLGYLEIWVLVVYFVLGIWELGHFVCCLCVASVIMALFMVGNASRIVDM